MKVTVIIAALELLKPSMTVEQRKWYAETIHSAAGCGEKKCDVDPLFVAAFIWHESGFRPGAVGDHGRAIGLGQSHSWLYSEACAHDVDPLGNPSPSCAAKRDSLKDPMVAIRNTTSEMRKARQVCLKKVGRKGTEQWAWLSLMGGRNHPRQAFQGLWCGHKRVKGTWRPVSLSGPKWREIREIVSCRQSLTRSRPCRLEDRSGPPTSRSTRRR